MEKTVNIGNKEIPMKVNANTPRMYREEFGKDMIVDLQKFMNHIDKTGAIKGDFDFSVIENMAFVMQKQAGGCKTIEEFLDQFEIDDVYTAMADIIGLWNLSKRTTSEAKKKANE